MRRTDHGSSSHWVYLAFHPQLRANDHARVTGQDVTVLFASQWRTEVAGDLFNAKDVLLPSIPKLSPRMKIRGTNLRAFNEAHRTFLYEYLNKEPSAIALCMQPSTDGAPNLHFIWVSLQHRVVHNDGLCERCSSWLTEP